MDAEVIVVGAGVNGLWCAYHLASQGIKSIIFDQFPLPHTMGSSHGQSRLTRTSIVDGVYADIMPECHQVWKKLQELSGRELLLSMLYGRPMGLFSLYNIKERGGDIDSSVENLKRLKIQYEVIGGEELSTRFPGLSSDRDFNGVLDKEAGLLKPESCLLALQEMYRKQGGKICDATLVTGIRAVDDSKVQVKTRNKVYTCESVILTCGPYINHLLSSVNLKLPVEPVRALVYYWTDKTRRKYDLCSGFPGTVLHPPGKTYLYTLPVYEYPGLMKICYHCEATINPYQRDKVSPEDQAAEHAKLEWLKSEIVKYFPDIDATDPAVTEVCMLTESIDKDFIIDFHPKHKNIVIGTGFSGRGFKTAPVIGRTLVAMATGKPQPYKMESFSLKRFRDKAKL